MRKCKTRVNQHVKKEFFNRDLSFYYFILKAGYNYNASLASGRVSYALLLPLLPPPPFPLSLCFPPHCQLGVFQESSISDIIEPPVPSPLPLPIPLLPLDLRSSVHTPSSPSAVHSSDMDFSLCCPKSEKSASKQTNGRRIRKKKRRRRERRTRNEEPRKKGE